MEQIIWLGVIVGVAIVIFITYLGVRHSKKVFVCNSLFGAVTLCLINVISGVTGFSLGYSALSILTSIMLGIPGVVGMLFLRLTWGV